MHAYMFLVNINSCTMIMSQPRQVSHRKSSSSATNLRLATRYDRSIPMWIYAYACTYIDGYLFDGESQSSKTMADTKSTYFNVPKRKQERSSINCQLVSIGNILTCEIFASCYVSKESTVQVYPYRITNIFPNSIK
jgi:hypothetical protein